MRKRPRPWIRDPRTLCKQRPSLSTTSFVCSTTITGLVTVRADRQTEYEEGRPTSEQLTSILEYLGNDKASQVVENASSPDDALKKLEQGSALRLPLTVDWNNGRVGEYFCRGLMHRDVLICSSIWVPRVRDSQTAEGRQRVMHDPWHRPRHDRRRMTLMMTRLEISP